MRCLLCRSRRIEDSLLCAESDTERNTYSWWCHACGASGLFSITANKRRDWFFVDKPRDPELHPTREG